jgi:ATP-binding cassette subfamily F protein uup
VLEESLEEFPGAVVLVSHDRELMDRLCTEYVGLDGRGGARTYGSVTQWLAALERAEEDAKESARRAAAPAKAVAAPAPVVKPKKLSYREQQELAGMEEAILAAEQAVSEREAGVERAATAGHVALAAACQELEQARQAVERLYARWQELESKRGAG